MGQLAQVPNRATDVSRRKRCISRVGSFVQINRINSLLLVSRENKMRRVDRHKDLLPIRVIQPTADEHTIPLVQQTRVQIQFAAHELKHIVGRTLTHRQESVRQSRSESELNIVAFLAASVNSDERATAQ